MLYQRVLTTDRFSLAEGTLLSPRLGTVVSAGHVTVARLLLAEGTPLSLRSGTDVSAVGYCCVCGS